MFFPARGTGLTFLLAIRHLWPKYIVPDRETQRFHMPKHAGAHGPSVSKHYAAEADEAAKTQANAYENAEYLGLELYVGHIG